MRTKPLLHSLMASALLTLGIVSTAPAQTATFARINDAVAGRCYDPATTAPDTANLNRLKIGIHPTTLTGTSCYASDNGPSLMTDTISFYIEAPAGHYISKITFTQSGKTSGSRGGRGFRSATWVVADKAYTVPTTASGWTGSIDLSLKRKTLIPVSITTYLAAYGGTVRSGSASASNPVVMVDLAPLQ